MMENLNNLNNLPINLFDVVVLIVLLISALFAYSRGFVHEVLAIASWLGAAVATFYLFPLLKPLMRSLFNDQLGITIDLAADFTSGVIIFVFAMAAFSVITRTISGHIKKSALNILDRSLGFLFGLLRGALLVAVAYIALELVLPPSKQPPWIKGARSMEIIRPAAQYLTSLLPETTGRSLSKSLNKTGDKNKSSDAFDKSDIVKKLISPKPESAPAPTRDGYGKKERGDMERLIESQPQ